MKLLSLPLSLLAAAGVYRSEAADVAWPVHGIVKFATVDAPNWFALKMEGCFDLTINNGTSKVKINNFKEPEIQVKKGGAAFIAEGGQAIVLFAMEEDRFDVITTVETREKTLETNSISFPKFKCNLAPIKITIDEKQKESTKLMHMYVSQEIVDVFQKKK